MLAIDIELEPEVQKRVNLVQEVIDRLVDRTTGQHFQIALTALLLKYPSNERPLDNTVPKLIYMNGEVWDADYV